MTIIMIVTIIIIRSIASISIMTSHIIISIIIDKWG